MPAKKKVIKKKIKKVVKKVAAKKAKVLKPVGEVTHFFDKIKVAIVKFVKPMKVGATIHVYGKHTDLTFDIGSMQHDHKAITTAPKGKEVGIKVKKEVRAGDKVFHKK